MIHRRITFGDEWESIPSVIGANHLLVIGIDSYLDFDDLNNAVRDCKSVVEVLQNQYRFDKVYQVYNQDATRQNIWKVFDSLKQRVKTTDNLIIYYAGHGYLDSNGWGYWIPADGRKNQSYTFFKNSDVIDWIKTFDCHHLMLISDSCFSGSLFRGDVEFQKAFSRDPSRWLLSSGRLQFVHDGKPGEGSPFNKYFVKYLRDNKQVLLFSELANKVKISTNSHTEMFQTPLAEPLMIKGHENGEFVFVPKRNEKQDWQLALNKNTREAFEIYLKIYPTGIFAEEAHWRVAILAKNKESITHFINLFPDGKYTEDAYWYRAGLQDTTIAYREYLTRFKGGKYLDKAISAQKICNERDFFSKAKKQGEGAIREYLRDIDKGIWAGIYKKEANYLLETLNAESPLSDPAGELFDPAQEKSLENKDIKSKESNKTKSSKRKTILLGFLMLMLATLFFTPIRRNFVEFIGRIYPSSANSISIGDSTNTEPPDIIDASKLAEAQIRDGLEGMEPVRNNNDAEENKSSIKKGSHKNDLQNLGKNNISDDGAKTGKLNEEKPKETKPKAKEKHPTPTPKPKTEYMPKEEPRKEPETPIRELPIFDEGGSDSLTTNNENVIKGKTFQQPDTIEMATFELCPGTGKITRGVIKLGKFKYNSQEEGDVKFQFTITPSGSVINVIPVSPIFKPNLTRIGKAGISKWKFMPIPRERPQVNQTVCITIKFRLTN